VDCDGIASNLMLRTLQMVSSHMLGVLAKASPLNNRGADATNPVFVPAQDGFLKLSCSRHQAGALTIGHSISEET